MVVLESRNFKEFYKKNNKSKFSFTGEIQKKSSIPKHTRQAAKDLAAAHDYHRSKKRPANLPTKINLERQISHAFLPLNFFAAVYFVCPCEPQLHTTLTKSNSNGFAILIMKAF